MHLTPKFKELSFLIYGLGLSGQSVVRFFLKKKINNFRVWDDREKKLFKNSRTKNLKKSLDEVNYIVLSPGISLKKNKKFIKYKKKIITDIDLFYLINKKAKSIVVTGTNGKSTTCKLLFHLLKKNKFNPALGGNIGTPILNLKNFKTNFVIIEASSFQLYHSQFIKPDYALFLNFNNDHLEWHGNKRNYLNSKLKIFSHQNQNHYAILNKKLKVLFRKRNFKGKLIIPKIKDYRKIKNKIKNSYLSSNINDENMRFVHAFSKILNIRSKLFIKSMETFRGLPHRFEIFFKKKDFIFINDSKATSFSATRFALSNFKNIYWILGGLPKQADKINLSNCKQNIFKSYLIGKNIPFFKNQIKGKIPFSETKYLKDTVIQIIKDAKLQNDITKIILLSPASASFDQYSNFEKRGEEFKRLCKKYGRKLI